ncbi:hypothetical protein [Streptomyces sp. ISL-11]|uniref:hypothetical protein n=1 Tax=Streptomyces sp. ISL-11 TaxID=2819174 RepID=UPI001BE8AB85|nr:hypothetical protein [Streptomyces sp. ISL-11]MBT2386328.1 hypothetical protein [Streptomyces sp. ISL-11]
MSYSLKGTLRAGLALGGAFLLFAALPTSSYAANGDFQYLRADSSQQDVISDPPNESCRTISGGAVNATNRTNAVATVYKNASCTLANRIKVLNPNGGMWDSGTTLVVAQRVCFTATPPPTSPQSPCQ